MVTYAQEGLPVLAFVLAIGVAAEFIRAQIGVRLALARGWNATEVVATSLRGLPTILALIVGIGLAAARVDLEPRTMDTLAAVLRALAVLAVTAKAALLGGRLVRHMTSREDVPLPSSTIFVNLTLAITWILGALIMLAALDISITPLLTALGVGGLAVGLALQPTLENLFSGVQVLMSRQIEPGDFVQLESGEQGWVEDVTWRNTTIKLFSNDLVIVPNTTIAKSRIVNFTTTDAEHVTWVDIGVAYGSDLEEVERITVETARELQQDGTGSVPDYEPLFRFTDFGDSAIGLTVSLRSESIIDRWVLRHEFIKCIHKRYAEAGIEIPFPQRTVHLEGHPSGHSTNSQDSSAS